MSIFTQECCIAKSLPQPLELIHRRTSKFENTLSMLLMGVSLRNCHEGTHTDDSQAVARLLANQAETDQMYCLETMYERLCSLLSQEYSSAPSGCSSYSAEDKARMKMLIIALPGNTFLTKADQTQNAGNSSLLHTLINRSSYGCGIDRELFQLIVNKAPKLLSQYDSEGFTPLHRILMVEHGSCSFCVDFGLVAFAVHSDPESASCIAPNGRCPLHLALKALEIQSNYLDGPCQSKQSYLSIRLLLDAYPQAAFTEVTDEKRVARFTNLEGTEGDEGTRVIGGQWETRVDRWTPLSRAQTLGDEHQTVKSLFPFFIDRYAQHKILKFHHKIHY